MYRLLIVDSSEASCNAIQRMLDWSAYGFSVVMTAGSYAEAVSKAVDLQPHIALVDTQLGEYPGYTLVDQLRSNGLKTSFCMLSTSNDPDQIRECMRSGAQDHLLRPLDPAQLQNFVERTILKELHGVLPSGDGSKGETDPVLRVPYSTLSRITNKIILVVRGNFRAPLTLTSIAETLNMSSKYIGRVFLKDTGVKFSEYLMSYRMLEARKLVVNTQEKISSIATMVGYAQLNNFYIHFKNFFGVSPSALRNFESPQEPGEEDA